MFISSIFTWMILFVTIELFYLFLFYEQKKKSQIIVYDFILSIFFDFLFDFSKQKNFYQMHFM